MRSRRNLRRWASADRAERGAILVEAALVIPILIGICLAVLDLGMGWRSALSVSNAVRAGARVGASQGVDSSTDHAVLLAIGAGLGKNSISEVDSIIVYKATSAAGTVPATCLTAATRTAGGSTTYSCNVYTSADLTTALANPSTAPSTFSGTCPGTRRDRFWCPTTRDNIAGTQGTGLDYLGVYLSVNHATSTKVFGSVLPITDSAVMAIEPSAGS